MIYNVCFFLIAYYFYYYSLGDLNVQATTKPRTVSKTVSLVPVGRRSTISYEKSDADKTILPSELPW